MHMAYTCIGQINEYERNPSLSYKMFDKYLYLMIGLELQRLSKQCKTVESSIVFLLFDPHREYV